MKLVLVSAFFMLLSVSAWGQTGVFTTYETTWDGLTRQYSVYVPNLLHSPPGVVVCLHATVNAGSTAPPLTYCQQDMGWEKIADRYGFLVVMPVSTWSAIGSGQWFWNAYNLAPLFAISPDDSGFIRNVIQTVSTQYGVDPMRVFAVGMSSGGFMSHRVGIDSSDLVAAIAPVSGGIWGDTSEIPNIVSPISVLEYHGDKDNTVPYCGGNSVHLWGAKIAIASVDDDVNYWLVQDGFPPNLTPLCTAGTPTSNVFSVDSALNGVEVTFIRELNYGHTYDSSVSEAIWEFFLTHPKTTSALAIRAGAATTDKVSAHSIRSNF